MFTSLLIFKLFWLLFFLIEISRVNISNGHSTLGWKDCKESCQIYFDPLTCIYLWSKFFYKLNRINTKQNELIDVCPNSISITSDYFTLKIMLPETFKFWIGLWTTMQCGVSRVTLNHIQHMKLSKILK